MTYTWYQMAFFFLIYSLLGWAAEVSFYAVTKRRFYNRGFLTLPFLPSYGVSSCLMLLLLPTLEESYVLSFLMTLILTSVVDSISWHLVRRTSPHVEWRDRSRLLGGSLKGFGISLAIAAIFYFCYLVLHPLLLAVTLLIPALVLEIVAAVFLVLMAPDFAAALIAMRKGSYHRLQAESSQNKLAGRLSDLIWKRLQKAYPGIREMDAEEEQSAYTFAKGLCWNKLFWVFFLCALLGDGIETLYCGFVDGEWMSRSSVLYGPFSFVWGIGAVVLTVTLQRLAGKSDRYVFVAGFVIGGAYEYMCSVFTERVFGTVFWDYSEMPLNIGGRTNVLFCFFWGLLATVWVKALYPRMSGVIEKVPPLAGQVATWVVMVVMVCNVLLTGAAMLRYTVRQEQPEENNMLEILLDENYDDRRMEARWPNMIVTE